EGISSRIPESVTFFDMYKVKKPQDFDSRNRWSQNQSHKTLAVPLGLRAEDDIVSLNLHEKAHGPHGLVAGTTGSGKSEIVQSYILSLALNFHPYEVGFLLIDYKGGGMANLFKNLPHLLGTITNLDKAESMRAMASIHSELLRRQQIFSECGVNHINGYNKLFKEGKVKEPLPHLFMISDEFAELKSEQPDFMAELVSTARIGRSLGIHLILATQKPSGVVDDQIWSNSRFKLCLKVADTNDSKEMLKTPDAASITQAGRAYLQVGNNEIYELFQSAWSGAKYDPNIDANEEKSQKEDNRVYLINEKGQGELINKDLSSTGSDDENKTVITQLDATVNYLS
ncbi:FtsK/SpoIIIE domain-containing protein, partial [Lachnobacterium bovis]